MGRNLAICLPEDVRSALCNGMGPRGGFLLTLLWLILRMMRIGVWFEAAANNHDVRYAQGGSEEHRDLADLLFLEDMLSVVDSLGSETLKGRYARYCAFKAYVAVQELSDNLGAFTFRESGTPLSLEELVLETRASGEPPQ